MLFKVLEFYQISFKWLTDVCVPAALSEVEILKPPQNTKLPESSDSNEQATKTSIPFPKAGLGPDTIPELGLAAEC